MASPTSEPSQYQQPQQPQQTQQPQHQGLPSITSLTNGLPPSSQQRSPEQESLKDSWRPDSGRWSQQNGQSKRKLRPRHSERLQPLAFSCYSTHCVVTSYGWQTYNLNSVCQVCQPAVATKQYTSKFASHDTYGFEALPTLSPVDPALLLTYTSF
jgi:hypothetical protein